MTTPETLKIINAVALGWPWQFLYSFRENYIHHENWVTPSDQSLSRLFSVIGISGEDTICLDPSFEWDWPVCGIEGIPVLLGHRNRDGKYIFTGEKIVSYYPHKAYSIQVLPNPLNPDQTPPPDWTPEGKRIIE